MKMKRWSSSEAIWPAIQKTRKDLFCQFTWTKFLKLCSAATLAEGVIVCYRYSVVNDLTENLRIPEFANLWTSPYQPLLIWVAASALTAACIIYYTALRLRFAVFDCLISNSESLGAAWARHGKTAMRMVWPSALSWVIVVACILIELSVIGIGAGTVLSARTPDGKLDPGVFLLMYLCAILTSIPLLICLATVQVVLNDFILPHMALEGLSFRNAFSSWRKIAAREKETFGWYVVLRISLSFALWLLSAVIATSLGYLLLWVCSACGSGYDFLLQDAVGIGAYLKYGVDVLFILLGVLTSTLLSVVFGGIFSIWSRNYAVLFYSGRYAKLGQALAGSRAEARTQMGYPHDGDMAKTASAVQ